MTRQTRLVASLSAIAIVGITALAFLADQYKKRPASAAAVGESPESRATRLVSGFLSVGRAPSDDPEALRRAGITAEEYVAVRDAAAAWSRGEPIADPALAAAIAARGGEVSVLALSR